MRSPFLKMTQRTPTACEVGSSPTRVQTYFLLTVVFGFLVMKGELRRPMPSALPVRSS